MIAVIDYGAGNLRSVSNTLDALQAPYTIVQTPAGLKQASKLVLPGVGHFGQMMRGLDAMDVRGVLVDRIESGVPFLGICLGMQALFEGSAEAPDARGLGIFPGRVERFPRELRVPHMGWNRVHAKESSRLFRNFTADPWFYFAHSYYVPASHVTSGECTYSLSYSAAIEDQNVFGVQFHPEKSAAAGLAVVKTFLEI